MTAAITQAEAWKLIAEGGDSQAGGTMTDEHAARSAAVERLMASMLTRREAIFAAYFEGERAGYVRALEAVCVAADKASGGLEDAAREAHFVALRLLAEAREEAR